MEPERLPPIRAVHDDELAEFLKSLGVYDVFVSGEMHCHFCGDVVSEENLHALFPDKGNIRVVCDKADCQVELTRAVRD